MYEIVENIMINNLNGLIKKLFAMRYPVRTVYSCLYTFVFFVFLLSIIFTLCGGETDTVFSANLAHFMSIAVFFVTLNRFCEAAAMVKISSGQRSLIKTFLNEAKSQLITEIALEFFFGHFQTLKNHYLSPFKGNFLR